MEPIPVICDRCRAKANAGADPFTALAGSLGFEPVKRERERVNGWSPERQRAFVAALVLTGSPKQAAAAVERDPAGVDKLKQAADGASFAVACDAAIALHRERERFRLDQSLAALARPLAPSPPPAREAPAESGPAEPADDLGIQILQRYAVKLAAERRARCEGRIAEADFALRQLTFIELCMEVAGLVHVLRDARIAGVDLVAIADTPLTRMLADIRHAVWRDAGEPERPHAPEHLMVDHGPCRTQVREVTGAGAPAPSWVDPQEWRTLDHTQQRARLHEQHARDAEAYKAWIETATAEWQRHSSPDRREGEGNHAEHGGGA